MELTQAQRVFVGLCIAAILLATGVGLYGRCRPTTPAPENIYTPPQTPAAPTTITVYVGGAVASPGLKTLPRGARVNDALIAAGGVTPDADTTQVNPAALLDDGQRIDVPARVASTPPPSPAPASPYPSQDGSPPRPININTATAEELETLPHIGPVLARDIVEYRKRTGGFRQIEDLASVPGIGPKRLAEIRPYIVLR